MQRRSVLVSVSVSVVGACAATASLGQVVAPGRPPLIAVAASAQQAMEALLVQFASATGQAVSASYGASGNFVRQIQQGLPAEIFMSADEEFALRLHSLGLAVDPGVVYASGRLALMTPPGSSLALDAQLKGLQAGWGGIAKFAIANPAIAPYGKAAREVLQQVGLWESAQAKLVLGESIAQATQFVASGSAQAGLTALSVLSAPDAAKLGRFVALPDSLHAPLRQRMVLLRGAGPAAQALYAYLQTPAAKETFKRYGFDS